MILSDREIRAAIRRGDIGLIPCPATDSLAWSSTAVDLTLAAEIRPWEPISTGNEEAIIDPAGAAFDPKNLIQRHTRPRDCTPGFILKPRAFVLGWTSEKLRLPHTAKLAARVEGKSSLARFGLGVHVTAPTIHAGFGVNETQPRYPGSRIQLEIWNAGPLDIRLTNGMAICQLIFEEVHGTPERGYAGQFRIQGPDTETGPRSGRRSRSR